MSKAMGNNNKNKNKIDMDIYSPNSPENVIRKVFLVVMIMVFPFVMNDMYFNITITRTKTFLYSVLGFFVFMLMAFVIEFAISMYFNSNYKFFAEEDEKVVFTPDFYVYMFFVANCFALYMAEDKEAALFGSNGRYFGLLMVLGLTVSYFLLSQRCKLGDEFLVMIFVSSLISNLIAFLQHFGGDPFGLRAEIASKQKEKFISTIGNINTYGSYLCIVIGIFFGIAIFDEKRWRKLVSNAGLFISSVMIITAKSDDVYIGITIMAVVFFYVAVANKRLFEYFRGLLVASLGLLFMAILNQILEGSTKHLNGLAKIIMEPWIVLFITAFILILTLVLFVLRKNKTEAYESLQGRTLVIGVTLLGLIAVVAAFLVGIRKKIEFFTFDYKWGTYRGYVWTKAVELFKMGSPLQKLFGYGNESVASLMTGNFYNEMVEVTNRTYDNLHNEVLQYLITTGIFGAISYIGIMLSAVKYFIKNLKKDSVVAGAMGAVVAYFFQGLVNLNQPITTPFYFIIIGAGVGYIRLRDKK